MVEGHSKTKGVHYLVPFPKINEPNDMLKSSTVYSSLECTSGYHYIPLLPKTQKKYAFVTAIDEFKFKKVIFGLTQATAHFQQ